MASFEVEIGSFALSTSAGNQDVTLSGFAGADQKIVFLWASDQTADGIRGDGAFMFGAATSSTSRFVNLFATDNGNTSTSDCTRRVDETKCITIMNANNGGGLVTEAADFVSFAANKFTVNVTTNGGAVLVNYLVLGGSGVSAFIDQISSPISTTGNQGYTGVGFQPDCLLAAHVASGSTPNSAATVANCIGFSDGVNDLSTYQYNQNGQATSNSYTRTNSSKFTEWAGSTQTVSEDSEVVSLDADGYTLNWTTSNGTAGIYHIVCLKGVQLGIVAFDAPTAGGAQTQGVTGMGFQPSACFLYSDMRASAGADDDLRVLLGSTDGTSDFCAGSLGEDGQTTTDEDLFHDQNECIKIYNHARVALAEATVDSMDADGLTVNWSNIDTTAHRLYAIGLAESSAGPTTTWRLTPDTVGGTWSVGP